MTTDRSQPDADPPAASTPATRRDIYYWKCDRPAAFHGVLRQRTPESDAAMLASLRHLLSDTFPGSFDLQPGVGEGTHRTYLLTHNGTRHFVRVEDGPEADPHLETESRVMAAVAQTGVAVPNVRFVDASRTRAPFAVQVIEYFDAPDLNKLNRQGTLPLLDVARQIGQAVGQWQRNVRVRGFGHFDAAASSVDGALVGYHAKYASYFRLNLERHLQILEQHEFLSRHESTTILRAIDTHADLLTLPDTEGACLVHKDIALWNILGTADGRIVAFIDWDDAVGGDPSDDLSLLACFHKADFVTAAIHSYEQALQRPLPARFIPRLWLHLLRNMIFKSVIRCGAGYFKPGSGANFLLPPGHDAASFRNATRDRVFHALNGLENHWSVSEL